MPLNVNELSERWTFGDPFDTFVDASFILLPEWNSCRADIDIALRRLKCEYLPSLAIHTFVDLSTYSSPIRSKFSDEEKCRQLYEISCLEIQCDAHEINYPKYKFYKEFVEIVDRELSRVRRMFHIIRKIIRNERVIGYTISLGRIKQSTILNSLEDIEEFYALQLTALAKRRKHTQKYEEYMRNTSKGLVQSSKDFINARNMRIAMRRIESIFSTTTSKKENTSPNEMQKFLYFNSGKFIKDSNKGQWWSNEKQSCENGIWNEQWLLPSPPLPVIRRPPVFIIPFPILRTIIVQNSTEKTIQEAQNNDDRWKNPHRNQAIIVKEPIIKQPETKQPMKIPPAKRLYPWNWNGKLY